MRKFIRERKKALAVLLAAVTVFTLVPETGYPVSGAEVSVQAEESAESIESTESIKNTNNTENSDNIISTENTENIGNTESTGDTESTGSTESTEAVGSTEDTESTEDIDSTEIMNETGNTEDSVTAGETRTEEQADHYWLTFTGLTPVSVQGKRLDGYTNSLEAGSGTDDCRYLLDAEYKYAIVELPENTAAYPVENGITSTEAVTLDAYRKFTVEMTADKTFEIAAVEPEQLEAPESVKYSKSISQVIDTEESYAITVTPASVSADAIAAVMSEELEKAGVTADITKETAGSKTSFLLNVYTGLEEAEGKIRIYDAAVPAAERTEENALCAIPVSVKNADLTVASVKTSKMTHYSAYLALKSKTKLSTSGSRPYYYEVKVTQSTGTEGVTAPDRTGLTEYNYFPYESQNQTIEVPLSTGTAKTGWNYELEVKLVQPSAEGWQTEGSSSPAECLNNETSDKGKKTLKVTTKAPYYEDKLTLTRKASTIYTGQTDGTVAVAKFSKNATYLQAVNAEICNADGTSYSGYGDLAMSASVVENGTVQITAGARVAEGKYIVKVYPLEDDGMYAAPASMSFSVKKGIRAVELSCSSQIYKPAGKAAAFQTSCRFYSDTYKDNELKNKKASYALYADSDCTTPLTGAMAQYISVNKNGKVTIAKGYQVASDNKDNTFYLKAQAADYEGNTADDVQEVVITSEVVKIADVYLAKYNSGTSSYEKVTGTEFTTKELEKLRVIAVNSEEQLIESSMLNYKSSSKQVKIGDYDGSCMFSGSDRTAKNVRVTVSVRDGGKSSKKTAKFSVVYAKPDSLELTNMEMESFSENVTLEAAGEAGTDYTYKAYGNSDLLLKCEIREAGEISALDQTAGLCNYSVGVRGGKLLFSKYYGIAWVTPTAKVTTVTLTDKGQSPAVKKVYTFTNENYAVESAPSAKLYKVNGNTKTGKIYRSEANQLTFRISRNGYSYVKVTGFLSGYEKIGEDNTFTVNTAEYGTEIGTNKLYVTYGSMGIDGKFIPQTKTAVLKVKVSDYPKAKVVASYKMKAEAESQAELQIKNGELNKTELNFEDAVLLNANVKGQANDFTQYFELSGEEDGNKYIRLKEGLSPETIASIKKTDLTGYITHTVYNGEKVTEKITIKLL